MVTSGGVDGGGGGGGVVCGVGEDVVVVCRLRHCGATLEERGVLFPPGFASSSSCWGQLYVHVIPSEVRNSDDEMFVRTSSWCFLDRRRGDGG